VLCTNRVMVLMDNSGFNLFNQVESFSDAGLNFVTQPQRLTHSKLLFGQVYVLADESA
jgi:hypothetical protein